MGLFARKSKKKKNDISDSEKRQHLGPRAERRRAGKKNRHVSKNTITKSRLMNATKFPLFPEVKK